MAEEEEERRPATMKDVRAAIRRKLKRVPEEMEMGLNIYPMMDMMRNSVSGQAAEPRGRSSIPVWYPLRPITGNQATNPAHPSWESTLSAAQRADYAIAGVPHSGQA